MARESGQAAMEAALVMPVWLVLTAGAIQLAMIQHARLMTEYAAFSAARAGIVWSGNNERMRDAALLALVPTFGGAATFEELGRSWERMRALDRIFHEALAARTPVPEPFKASGLLGLVRVDTVAPATTGGAEELPFDQEGARTEADAVRASLSTHGERPNSDTPALLTVRVRHWFELRLPFVNGIIFDAWIATAAAHPADAGLATLAEHERQLLLALADGVGPLGRAHRYFLPLSATWTLRMQSDFHRKWLMHEGGPTP